MSFEGFRRLSFRIESLDLLKRVEGTKAFSNVNLLRTRGKIEGLDENYRDANEGEHKSLFMIHKQRGNNLLIFPYHVEIITSQEFRIYREESVKKRRHQLKKVVIEFRDIKGIDLQCNIVRLVLRDDEDPLKHEKSEKSEAQDEKKQTFSRELDVRFQYMHNMFFFLNYLNAYRLAMNEKSILIPGPNTKTFYDRVTQKRLRERFKRVMKKKKGFLMPVFKVIRNIFAVHASHETHTLDGKFQTFEMKHAGLPFYGKSAQVWDIKDFHQWLDHIVIIVDKKREKKKKSPPQMKLPPRIGVVEVEESTSKVESPSSASSKKKKKCKKSKKKSSKKQKEEEPAKKEEEDESFLPEEDPGGPNIFINTISTVKRVLEERDLLKHLDEYFTESKQSNVMMMSLRRDIENHFNPQTPQTPQTPLLVPSPSVGIGPAGPAALDGSADGRPVSLPGLGHRNLEILFEEAEDVMRRILFHCFILTEFWGHMYNINFFRVFKRVVYNYQKNHLLESNDPISTTTVHPEIMYDLEKSVLFKYRYLWDLKELQQNLMVHMLYNQSLDNFISTVETSFLDFLIESSSQKKMKTRREKMEKQFSSFPEDVLQSSPWMKDQYDEISQIPLFWDPQEFGKAFQKLNLQYNITRPTKRKQQQQQQLKNKKEEGMISSPITSSPGGSRNSPGGRNVKKTAKIPFVLKKSGVNSSLSSVSSGHMNKLKKEESLGLLIRKSMHGGVSLENLSFIIHHLLICTQLYSSLLNQQAQLLNLYKERVKNLSNIKKTKEKIQKVKNSKSSSSGKKKKNIKPQKKRKSKSESSQQQSNQKVVKILSGLLVKEEKRLEELEKKYIKLHGIFLIQKEKINSYIISMNAFSNNKFFPFFDQSYVPKEVKMDEKYFDISNDESQEDQESLKDLEIERIRIEKERENEEWKQKEFEYFKNNFLSKTKVLEFLIENELERIENNGTHILEIKYKMILAKKSIVLSSSTTTKQQNNKKTPQQNDEEKRKTYFTEIFNLEKDFRWSSDPYVCYFIFRNIVFYFLDNSLIVIDDLENPKYPISKNLLSLSPKPRREEEEKKKKKSDISFTDIMILDSDCPLIAAISFIERIMEKFSDHLVLYNSEIDYSNLRNWMTPEEDLRLENSIKSPASIRKSPRHHPKNAKDNEMAGMTLNVKKTKRRRSLFAKKNKSKEGMNVQNTDDRGGKQQKDDEKDGKSKKKKKKRPGLSQLGEDRAGHSLLSDEMVGGGGVDDFLDGSDVMRKKSGGILDGLSADSSSHDLLEGSEMSNIHVSMNEEERKEQWEIDNDMMTNEELEDLKVMVLIDQTIQRNLQERKLQGGIHHETSLIPKIHMNTQEFVMELLTILSSSPCYPIVQKYLQNLKTLYHHLNLVNRKKILNEDGKTSEHFMLQHRRVYNYDNYTKEEEMNDIKRNPFFVVDPIRYVEVNYEFFSEYCSCILKSNLVYKRFGPKLPQKYSFIHHQKHQQRKKEKEEEKLNQIFDKEVEKIKKKKEEDVIKSEEVRGRKSSSSFISTYESSAEEVLEQLDNFKRSGSFISPSNVSDVSGCDDDEENTVDGQIKEIGTKKRRKKLMNLDGDDDDDQNGSFSPVTSRDDREQELDRIEKEMSDMKDIMQNFPETPFTPLSPPDPSEEAEKNNNKVVKEEEEEEENAMVSKPEEKTSSKPDKPSKKAKRAGKQLSKKELKKQKKQLSKKELKKQKKNTNQSHSSPSIQENIHFEDLDQLGEEEINKRKKKVFFRLFFRSHQEIDKFTMSCIEQNSMFAKDWQGIWHLLKAFDRAFTSRHDNLTKQMDDELYIKTASISSSPIKKKEESEVIEVKDDSEYLPDDDDVEEEEEIDVNLRCLLDVVKADRCGCPFRQLIFFEEKDDFDVLDLNTSKKKTRSQQQEQKKKEEEEEEVEGEGPD